MAGAELVRRLYNNMLAEEPGLGRSASWPSIIVKAESMASILQVGWIDIAQRMW